MAVLEEHERIAALNERPDGLEGRGWKAGNLKP